MNTSADLAALVAGGDISITGQGTTTSSFQGLILAEGSFKAKDTTLIGSALTLDKNGSVQLERVRTVAARDLTKIDLNYAVELNESVRYNGANTPIALRYNGQVIDFTKENLSKLEKAGLDSYKAGIPVELGIKQGTDFIPESDPAFNSISYRIRVKFDEVAQHWGAFEDQVATNKIQYTNVFQLDLNKFLKTKGGLRPLLQRVSSL